MSELELEWAGSGYNACAANGVTADGRSYHYSSAHNGYVFDEPPGRGDVTQALSALTGALAAIDDPRELVETLNEVRSALHELSPLKHHPVDFVRWVPAADVHANDYNPNQVAPPEMELLRLSIDHDGYCVEASTPVLCADFTWRPAGDLLPGDRLIAFDENSTGTGMKSRRFRTAEVTFNEVREDDLYRVTTSRGDVLTNAEHPWLAQRMRGSANDRLLRWIATKDLRPDDLVVHVVEPWEQDMSWESGWLAGFLDGEGTLAQNQAITHRFREVIRLLGTVRPERLIEAGGPFWEGVSLGCKDSRATVISVAPAGRGPIASLATSTRTYIAAGFAMHNTQPIVTHVDEEDHREVVDGFHRHRVGTEYPEVAGSLLGFLPAVQIRAATADRSDRIAATIRHNRARGKHQVVKMTDIVLELKRRNWSDAKISKNLGMDPDEVLRLSQIGGLADVFADRDFSMAWEVVEDDLDDSAMG